MYIWDGFERPGRLWPLESDLTYQELPHVCCPHRVHQCLEPDYTTCTAVAPSSPDMMAAMASGLSGARLSLTEPWHRCWLSMDQIKQ